MDIENLKEKKKILEQLLAQTATQLQEVENTRNQLTTKAIEIRGKVQMLDELIKEQTNNNE